MVTKSIGSRISEEARASGASLSSIARTADIPDLERRVDSSEDFRVSEIARLSRVLGTHPADLLRGVA